MLNRSFGKLGKLCSSLPSLSPAREGEGSGRHTYFGKNSTQEKKKKKKGKEVNLSYDTYHTAGKI